MGTYLHRRRYMMNMPYHRRRRETAEWRQCSNELEHITMIKKN